MRAPPRRRIGRPDGSVDPGAVQDAHDDTVSLLAQMLALGVAHNGALLEGINVTGGVAVELHHQLGRAPRFVLVVLSRGTWITVFVNDGQPDIRNKVTVTPSGTGTVNVLVA